MIETETVMARKPTSLYHVESAVVPISGLTAWQGFFRKAKLERGQDFSAGALRRGAVAFCANPSIRIPCLKHCIQPWTRAKDQTQVKEPTESSVAGDWRLRLYATSGYPLALSAKC